MPKAQVEDILVDVEIAGAGVPLVLLHGWFLNSRMWKPQVEGLAEDFRLIVPDLRGHGGTPCPVTGRSFDRPRDVIQVMDELGVAQAFICGLSMGGPVALQIALDYPERCLGIILLSTGPGSGDRPLQATEEMRVRAEQEAQQLLRIGTLDYFYAGLPLEEPGLKAFLSTPTYRDFFDSILASNKIEWLADGIRLRGCDVPVALENHLPSRRIERLPEIRLPTLVMLGSEDTTFLPMAKFFRSMLPQAQIEVVEGVGHMINVEAAGIVNEHILQFKDS